MMSGCSNAVLLTDLVLFCCFVMSDWLEAVWVSDEEQRLSEWASGWPALENRFTHMCIHTHIHKRTVKIQMSPTATQNLSCPFSLYLSFPLSAFYLTLSVLFPIALLLAMCKFIHCENGRLHRATQFHLVLCSVSRLSLSAPCSRPHFK